MGSEMCIRDSCVLCARCVRASRELDGKAVFGFEGRGPGKSIAVNAADGLGGTDAEASDHAVAACPTASQRASDSKNAASTQTLERSVTV